MANLKAQIEISADASGVEAGVTKAKRSLADLGASAQVAGQQASSGLRSAGDGGGQAATNVDRATKSIIGSIERTTAVLQAGGRGTREYFEALASQRGISGAQLKPYLDALDQVAAKQATAKAATEATAQAATAAAANSAAATRAAAAEAGIATAAAAKAAAAQTALVVSTERVGMSAKATNAALRQVPAQVTDIVVGLQGGQAPLTVLLQQGGQLKDVFGGIGPAARALGGYIVSLINPFTVVVAAAAALGYVFSAGARESAALTRALILSGNAAGTTAGQLSDMARSVAAIGGTRGQAAEVLTQLASTGAVAAVNLEKVTLASIQLERVGGQAASKTAEQFAGLAREPLAASIKLNEATHFLTLSLYQQIKALDDTGRSADAAALAQKGYADALLSRAGQVEARLGAIERGWRAVKTAAASAWDAMLNVGREASIGDQIKKAEEGLDARIKQRQSRRSLFGVAGGGESDAQFEAGNAAARLRIDTLKESARLSGRVAENEGAATRQVEARIRFDKEGEQYLSNREKRERAIAKARAEGAAAGASEQEIARRVAGINERLKDPKPPGGRNTQIGIDKSELARDLSVFKAASDELVGTYRNAEQILEAIRATGTLGEREYYEAKRAFINLESDARADALQKSIARLEQEKAAFDSAAGDAKKKKEDRAQAVKEGIDTDRKIGEEQTKLAILRADATAKLTVLSIQEQAAGKRLELSYLTARQAAQDYFDLIERQQAREISGLGKGDQARRLDAGVRQIEDRYQAQRRDLENEKARLELEDKFTVKAKESYDQRLAIIDEFQSRSIASFKGYYDRLLGLQEDWRVGADEAFQNYIDSAGNVSKQSEDAFGRALGGIENAFVSLSTTGKFSFKSLAESIIADIVRIQAKAAVAGLLKYFTGGSLNIAGGASSAGFGTGAGFGNQDIGGFLADGGPALAGTNYIVGERGPEILRMGNQGGQVIPTDSGRPVTLNVINNGAPARASTKQRETPEGTIIELVLDAVVADVDAGGRTAGAFSRRFGANGAAGVPRY